MIKYHFYIKFNTLELHNICVQCLAVAKQKQTKLSLSLSTLNCYHNLSHSIFPSKSFSRFLSFSLPCEVGGIPVMRGKTRKAGLAGSGS